MKNELLVALYEMLTFKSVTSYPRWVEIFLGVSGWYFVVIIIYSIIQGVK